MEYHGKNTILNLTEKNLIEVTNKMNTITLHH